MKLSIALILLILFGFSSYIHGQENMFYNKSMIALLLKDTVEIADKELIKEIKNLVSTIESDKGIPSKMFPFTEYDSVLTYRLNSNVPKYLEYENEEDKKNNPKNSIFEIGGILKKEALKNGVKLSEKQIEKLLELINIPGNFDYGYIAGANFTIGLIAFYRKGEIKGYIHIDSMYIMFCNPQNVRVKHGLLKRDSDAKQFFYDIGFRQTR